MAVIHIFKDGTTTKELKNVTVPKELLQSLMKIVERRKEEKEIQANGT